MITAAEEAAACFLMTDCRRWPAMTFTSPLGSAVFVKSRLARYFAGSFRTI